MREEMFIRDKNGEQLSVKIKVVRVGEKQLTQILFKQIQKQSILDYDHDEGLINFRGRPIGFVANHWPEGLDGYSSKTVGVLWQFGDELRRCLLEPESPFWDRIDFSFQRGQLDKLLSIREHLKHWLKPRNNQPLTWQTEAFLRKWGLKFPSLPSYSGPSADVEYREKVLPSFLGSMAALHERESIALERLEAAHRICDERYAEAHRKIIDCGQIFIAV